MLLFAAKDRGPGFDFTDPETGKAGKANVGVTVGNFRGDKLVSLHCLALTDCDATQQTAMLHNRLRCYTTDCI